MAGAEVTIAAPGPVVPLGVALKREIDRVRDEVIPSYPRTGLSGAIEVDVMLLELEDADAALTSGDPAAMVAAYLDLKGWTL